LGILLGTLVFSIAFEWRYSELLNSAPSILRTMTPLALVLIVLALIQYAITLFLPKTTSSVQRVATHDNSNSTGSLTRLYHSPVLWPTVIGMTAFWCIGQMLLATYPAFAKDNMGISSTIVIQGLLSMIAIGIMLGSALAGVLSKRAVELALLPISALMIISCLAAIPFTTSQLLAWPLFLATGIAGGLFIVPLMGTLQILSKPAELGSNLSANNLIQNIAMTSCLALTAIAAFYAMPSQWILSFILCIALSSLSYLLWRMPQSIRSLKTFHWRVQLHDELDTGFHPYENYCYVIPHENRLLTLQAIEKINPVSLIAQGDYFFNNAALAGEKIHCSVTASTDNCVQLTLQNNNASHDN
jgi:acyl-[acyl-carrier-protein]-phospholipid O-acyltransferase/long-chain-fatty-acid--[acyl-carrier-protein] ligase